jgi:hypothetical protein
VLVGTGDVAALQANEIGRATEEVALDTEVAAASGAGFVE